MSRTQYKLGEIAPFKYGKSLSAKKRIPGNIPVYSSAGITGSHNAPLVTEPSIVIGPKGNIGSVHFAPNPFFPIDTVFYTKGSSKVILKYLFYLLHELPLEQMNNDSAVPGLNREQAENLIVDIPDIAEQQAIAATLGALDDKIESNLRIATKIEQLIFAQFDSLFNIAASDTGVPISSLIGVNLKRKLSKGEVAVKIPMANLPEGTGSIFAWTRETVSGGTKFMNGDVLFARITPCLENGKTAIVDMLNEGDVGFGSTEFIVLSPQGDISTAWIYALARNEAFRVWAQKNMTGSTGRQRFQARYLDDYLVEPPSPQALIKFNENTEPIVSMLTAKRNETIRLQALRETLLPELMSGRIRVPEACAAVQNAVDTGLPEVSDV